MVVVWSLGSGVDKLVRKLDLQMGSIEVLLRLKRHKKY